MSLSRVLCRPLAGLCAILFVAACGSSNRTVSSAADDPSVVATYADEAMTLSAFEARYARAVGGVEAAQDDSLAEYQDFLERYVNFRLKVMAAEAAGLNADPGLQEEISTYRQNLAKPYLLEQEVLEPLIRKLYDRQQEMVDVSHILVRVGPDASPADTVAAYNKLAALVDSIEAGMDFSEVAFRYSEDPSARRPEGLGGRGRLGFFKAGRLIEPFEETAYATEVGSMSPIFRTRFGYHVLFVHDRQPTVQEVRLAHILLRPDGPTPEDSTAMWDLARDLMARIEGGADFAELAREFSEDPGSGRAGGDLGFVGYDVNFVEPFKTVAFSLENPGDVSDLVETRFGVHIIKLLERKAPRTYEDAYEDLKGEVSRLPRAQEAEAAFAEEARARLGTTVDSAVVESVFAPIPPDSIFFVVANGSLPDSVMAQTVATLGDSTYSVADLAGYTIQAQLPRSDSSLDLGYMLLDLFLTERAIEYEALLLEERDAEFKTIMDEFRDGLLLFRLMEDSVWTAASEDSLGLLAYYEPRAADYRFPDRTRILSLQHPVDSVLSAAVLRLDEGLTMEAFLAEMSADSTSLFRLDTTFVSSPTGSVYDRALSVEEGEHTEVFRNQGRFTVLFNDGIEPARQKTFDEARSEVVSAYQEVLENELLARLRARYDVRTYPARLVSAFAEDRLEDALDAAGAGEAAPPEGR